MFVCKLTGCGFEPCCSHLNMCEVRKYQLYKLNVIIEIPLYTLNFSVARTCKPLSHNVADLSLVISSLKVTFVELQTSIRVLW